MKLRHHMILLIAGPSLAIYVLILGLAGFGMYQRGKQEAESAMTRLAASYSARLDGYLREAARVAETTAQFMDVSGRLSDEEIYSHLESNVSQMALIYGSCLAFEPGTRKAAGELFAPYVCRAEAGLQRMNIDRSVYDWYADPMYTWYSRPKQLRHAVWSEPYFDDGAGNILMSTYSAPFATADGFGGVCTVDIDLPHLRRAVGSQIQEELDFVILSGDGRYVYHPDSARIMSRTLMDEAIEAGHKDLVALAPTMLLNGPPGSAWIRGWDSEQAIGVFYAPVSSTGWVFVCRLPAAEVLRDVRYRMAVGGGALVAALLLIGCCVYFVAGRIAGPISALERQVGRVSGGDLDSHIDESASATEIRTLARSFNKMTSDLRANIQSLASEQAARQRIEHDLSIARKIQTGLLPKAPPRIAGFQISGWSRAADQTGGDYFDWIELPNGQVVIAIADATGHGIGPALLISVCRAYFRSAMQQMCSISEAIVQVNNLLMADMTDGRFVTAALCMIDPSASSIEVFSAGHGPIIIYSAATGEALLLDTDQLPLGVDTMVGGSESHQRPMAHGDLLVLTTDGFFEWLNAEGQRYGIETLKNFVKANHALTPEEFITALHHDVLRHAAGTSQDDDLTVVIVKRTDAQESQAPSTTPTSSNDR